LRIEPGEVEAVLASHPAVAGCAVVVDEVRSGECALVAYYAATEGADLSREAARGFLSSQLPDYMVPAVFVALSSLPLTPNGKVDRSRLPEPREAPEYHRARRQGPSDQLELHLVKLWERMLGVEGVGIHDNFFELGGHSLLAAQLFDEIERQFGRRLPLDTLWYKGASIAEVAHLLREGVQSVTWPILIPIKPSGSKPPLFVVHTIGGNLFHYDHFARALDPDQPVMGLQARGVYGREQPRHRIEDIAADCIDALRSHQAQGPYLIAGYSSAGIVAFEIARQLESAGEKVGLLALIDSFSPRAKRKRSLAQAAAEMLRRVQLRHVQERAYHAVLHWTGLSHRRRLGSVGQAQRWAYWSYRARPYAGAACLFVANASLEMVHEPTLGWEQLVQGGLHVHRLPGGHSSIMKAPLVAELAATLQSELDRATAALSAARRAAVS
jgi:thioesterase domain-containing protein/acyl carrier protein